MRTVPGSGSPARSATTRIGPRPPVIQTSVSTSPSRPSKRRDLRRWGRFQRLPANLSRPALGINAEELDFVRQQEQRWCADMKELLRRMTQDGYRYQIEFDNMMPESAIDIVVVEEVDEILQQRQRATKGHKGKQQL